MTLPVVPKPYTPLSQVGGVALRDFDGNQFRCCCIVSFTGVTSGCDDRVTLSSIIFSGQVVATFVSGEISQPTIPGICHQ